MPMAECRSCHKRADSRAFRHCSDCGAPLCDDCANEYSGLGPDCLWIELASAPGGLSAPIPADLTCLPAGGLPGKYLPESAAAVLFEAILRHWEVEP